MASERQKLRLAEPEKVRPLAGSIIDQKMRKNAEWLFSLDPERLLAEPREAAGIDPGNVQRYGGWGSYYYYYLRAMCNLYHSFTGVDDGIAEEAKKRALVISEGMRECQEATSRIRPAGFITPIMEDTFAERMKLTRDSVYSHTHISSIMYSVHKDMIAWILTYRAFQNENALKGLKIMARRVRELMAPYSQEERERMTDSRRVMDFFSEAGGIMDAFLLLYEDTKDPEYLDTAAFFRRSWFDRMFLADEEKLAWGMEHVNSEIPYVESLADLYLLTGEEDALTISRNFMKNSVEAHELPQGSVSGRSAFPDYQSELYNYPKRIYYHIMDTKTRKNIASGESCCAHNLNRVAEKLLTLSPDVSLMDAWERRFVNAVLSQQNLKTGQFIYNQNLKTNTFKMWGYPEKSFWCCYGTGAEVYASLTAGAFYEDDTHAYACLYMPCEYTHTASGIRITEETAYPDDGRISFTIHGSGRLSLVLRIPSWLQQNARVTLPDGEVKEIGERGVLYEIDRVFTDGDRIILELPFDLAYRCMPDRHEYVSLTYGPNLLVLTGPGEQLFQGSAEELLHALEPAGAPCTFQAEFQAEECGGTHTVLPFRLIQDETYSGYFHVTKAPQRIVTDTLEFADAESLSSHGFTSVGLEKEDRLGHTAFKTTLTFFSDPGEFCFDLKADPEKEMLLRLYLDGGARMYIHQFSGHSVNPLFDLEVFHDGDWKVFSTKSCEGDFPGEIVYEDFVIPEKWTKGKEELKLRLAARNFHEIPGVIETLMDRIELFYVPVSCGVLQGGAKRTEGVERFHVPNAQGL